MDQKIPKAKKEAYAQLDDILYNEEEKAKWSLCEQII